MLNDNYVNNADACKKLAEIEKDVNIVEKAVVWSLGEDIPAIGIEENICLW